MMKGPRKEPRISLSIFFIGVASLAAAFSEGGAKVAKREPEG